MGGHKKHKKKHKKEKKKHRRRSSSSATSSSPSPERDKVKSKHRDKDFTNTLKDASKEIASDRSIKSKAFKRPTELEDDNSAWVERVSKPTFRRPDDESTSKHYERKRKYFEQEKSRKKPSWKKETTEDTKSDKPVVSREASSSFGETEDAGNSSRDNLSSCDFQDDKFGSRFLSDSDSERPSRNTELRDMSPPSPLCEDVEYASQTKDPEPDEFKLEIYTQDELNKIAAEVLRAEMMGTESEVTELKNKLKKAQDWLAGKGKVDRSRDKEVLLTHTDKRGFTRPLDTESLQKGDKTKSEKKKEKRRARVTAEDEYYDGGGNRSGDEKEEVVTRRYAEKESAQREKTLDSCRLCLDSLSSNRKLIVSLLDKVYLSVPPYQSLTEGHCLIVPVYHTTCTTILDEDVFEQVKDMRKLLVRMFNEEEKDIIFYENAKNLNKYPHMVINCVPVPKEIGEVAPIYFKKAILECETEWSNNKKVVELKGRDVRKAIPKGLPYFSVDFGLDGGYAHVIEDERLFPGNFAEEILGGMLELDHSVWRKRREDEPSRQASKAQEFIAKFKKFTSTKQW